MGTEASSSFDFLVFLKKFITDGGVFMWVILLAWAFGIAICIYKYITLKLYRVNEDKFYEEVKKRILTGQIEDAINFCSASKALLPKIVTAGLMRANAGKEKIENSIYAMSLEVVPKISYKMNSIALIANISTLLGLLGTIQGLIFSFAGVANVEPSQKAKVLALGISQAMNTTALGLVSAISIMVIHSYLVGKSQKMLDKIEEVSFKLSDLLAAKDEK